MQPQALSIAMRVFRAVMIYLIFAAIMSLALLFSVFLGYSLTDRPLGAQLDFDMFQYPFIVQTVITPFLLNSLLRIFAERDALIKKELYPGADHLGTPRQILKTVVTCRYFWIQLGTLALLLCALPMQIGFYPLYFLFSHTVLPPLAQKAILIACLIPLLLAAALWQHTAAFYTWQADEMARRPDRSAQFLLPLLGVVGFYLLCLLLLPTILSVLLMAFSFLAAISFSLIGVAIVGIVLLAVLIRYIRALFIRRAFIRNLRQRCEKNGFALSKIERPYRSIFRIKDGFNFTVTANKKTYPCKLLAAPSRGNAMAISPEGIAYVIHIFGLRILPRRRAHLSSEFLGGARHMLGGNAWYTHMELFRFTTKTDFSFEGEGQKVLIVNPVPYALFSGTQTQAHPIDNGETVGAYKVFAGTAFLNALERNCIDP
ncbi:MAG: hypothetical protein E7585_06205 [Ruminococcaceae bacterium]|nr:hypothetical protein [Oscillospiraceae bacterium]